MDPKIEIQKSQIASPPPTIRASWNFSQDHIRANCANYPPDTLEILVNAYLWCIDPSHPISRSDFGRRVGASENLLYKLYTGKYRNDQGEQINPSSELLSNIRHFLALEKERFDAGKTDFVLTPTAKRIATSCELARESNSIVFLWGPSQIGKTWGLEYHAASHNHGRTPYVRMGAASGVSNMIKRIAARCGISDRSNTEDLTERIKNALGPDALLILDECHLLFNTIMRSSADRCFEKLREIHDETRCGMVWSFTILDEMRARSGSQLQQAWRRGVHKVPLPLMPTKGDLGAILQNNGLNFPAATEQITVGTVTERPYEVLRHIAKTEGLKAITERLRYGRKLANKTGDKLAWKHVLSAHLLISKQAQQEGEWK